MKRTYAVIVALAAALSLSSCSATPTDQLAELRTAINAGKECPELFPLLKAIPNSEAAQGEMRSIGCYSSSSKRSDTERSKTDPNSDWIGVTGGKRVEVSNECLNASKRAANEVNSEAAEMLIRRTLEACQETNEWLSAVAKYPGVMGMVEGSIPSVTDIEVACMIHPDTAVCKDFGKL
ncbi:hypothetical protein [Paeniglutamicibacter cryotolerans]|uniref:Lipoprotein n=1 Tax=Paeniglutamicibacter cryotolerans TaxID=670079 RepID=A0A839QM40_9MICC|nr:hypothetical protein [Paeniglutamicibacter cryotolerans]MBB2997498.1 hypothetical protein [Paeniglutamicibacter cryotolerans]